MYNGPLRVYVQGAGGSENPRFPALVSKGRALLGTLAARASVIGPTALASRVTDGDGNSVKALHTPDVKKLFISIGVQEEEQDEKEPEGPEDKTEAQTWVEVHRDYAETVDIEIMFYAGEKLGIRRIARITYKTPSEELVRLLLDEEDESGTESESGPTPDTEWLEKEQYRETVTTEINGTNHEAVIRVVFEDTVTKEIVAFDYATSETLPVLPVAATRWTEMSRGVALIDVDGSVELERTVDVTFFRYVYHPDYKTLKTIRFVYEEGQEEYTWPDYIEVLEPARSE